MWLSLQDLALSGKLRLRGEIRKSIAKTQDHNITASADTGQTSQDLFKGNINSLVHKALGSVSSLATVLANMVGELFDDPRRYGVLLKLLPHSAELDNLKRAMTC